MKIRFTDEAMSVARHAHWTLQVDLDRGTKLGLSWGQVGVVAESILARGLRSVVPGH